jgi:outer membrane immunogenic protein
MRSSTAIFSVAIATGALVGIGAASAADLPAQTYTKAPAAVTPVHSWTGCHVGGNLGGGWSKQDQNRVGQIGNGPAPPVFYGSETDSAFIGGGQVGCDYQFGGSWVAGIQGQLDWGSVNGSHALPSFPTFTMFDKTTFVGTATARIAYLFAPLVLGYVKGGAAWSRNSDFLNQPSGALSESAAWNRSGWTVGGGLEWMFAPNWSVFAEYNYMDFGTKLITFIAPPSLLPVGEHIKIRHTVQTALVGVNYKFNWGGPVVAKY